MFPYWTTDLCFRIQVVASFSITESHIHEGTTSTTLADKRTIPMHVTMSPPRNIGTQKWL
jgi:hypothetical protein